MLKAILTPVSVGLSQGLHAMMPPHMKRLRILLIALVLALGVTSFLPLQHAYADTADEEALATVEDEVSLLWEFADQNNTQPDADFYPAFVDMADSALKKIDKAEKQLAKSKETKGTKRAVELLREDVQQIQVGIIAWRESAAASDGAGFEDASYFLQGVVGIYNDDVDAYNRSAYGTKATMTMLAYILPLVLSFTAAAFLFAWAVLRNNHSQEVIVEIQRKLRWHMAIWMLVPIVTGTLLGYLFFFTAVSLWWAWVLFGASFLPLVYEIVRYIRIKLLVKQS